MTVLWLATLDIDPTERAWHSCRYFSDVEIESMAATIHAGDGKLLQPIGVRAARSDSRYQWEVVFGRRRLLACIRAQVSTIPVMVHEVDDDAARVLSLRENHARHKPKILERSWGLHRLEAQGYCGVQIHQLTGIDETSVSQGLKIARLLPEHRLLSVIEQRTGGAQASRVLQDAVRMTRDQLLAIADDLEAGSDQRLLAAVDALMRGQNLSRPRPRSRAAKKRTTEDDVNRNNHAAGTTQRPDPERHEWQERMSEEVALLRTLLEQIAQDMRAPTDSVPSLRRKPVAARLRRVLRRGWEGLIWVVSSLAGAVRSRQQTPS